MKPSRILVFFRNPIYYRALLLCSVLFSGVSYLSVAYRILVYVCLAWGGLLLFDLVFIRRAFSSILYRFLSAALLAGYIVTIILNRPADMVNELAIVVFALIYCVLFIGDMRNRKLQQIKDEWATLSTIAIIFLCAVMLISTALYLSLFAKQLFIGQTLQLFGSNVYIQTVRLFGVCPSPIGLGTVAALSILISICSLALCKECFSKRGWKIWRVVCAVNILLSYICMIASASFSGMVIVYAFIVWCVLWLGKKWLQGKRNMKACPAMLLSFAMSACICVAVFLLGNVLTTTMNSFLLSSHVYDRETQSFSSQEELSELTEEERGGFVEITADREVSTNFMTGRLNIWKHALSNMGGHWLFGHGRTSTNVAVFYDVPGQAKPYMREYQNLHNGYISVLYALGIWGLGIILYVIACIAGRTIKCLWKSTPYFLPLVLFSGIAVGVLGYNMAMESLLLTRGLSTYLLFLTLGYCVFYTSIPEDSKC